jgi:hypothetical protein
MPHGLATVATTNRGDIRFIRAAEDPGGCVFRANMKSGKLLASGRMGSVVSVRPEKVSARTAVFPLIRVGV